MRVAIWTCGSKANLPLAELARLGFHPELVLACGDCVLPSAGEAKRHGLNSHTFIKDAHKWFSRESLDGNRVVFVDDTIGKYRQAVREHHLVFADTWYHTQTTALSQKLFDDIMRFCRRPLIDIDPTAQSIIEIGKDGM